MSGEASQCILVVNIQHFNRDNLKTVRLLTEVEAYYTKKGTMEAMEAMEAPYPTV